MLWLLVLAIAMPSLGSCAETKNLTAVTWDHAVNSWSLLNKSLESEVHMIEADVIIGEHKPIVVLAEFPEPEPFQPARGSRSGKGSPQPEELKDAAKIDTPKDAQKEAPKDTKTPPNDGSSTYAGQLIPVMGHPPANSSDLSLAEFLKAVTKFNAKDENKNKTKGVKLDFKSADAFAQSSLLLKKSFDDLKFPIWINADILEGPLAQGKATPVNPKEFFAGAKDLKGAKLSIGWTTHWEKDTAGNYTQDQIDAMITVIKEAKLDAKSHTITFPIRATFAHKSKEVLKFLHKTVNDEVKIPATLTLWSAADDHVDAAELKSFILSFGVDQVYIDLPKQLEDSLNLGKNSASSLVHFGLLNVAAFALAFMLRNGFH